MKKEDTAKILRFVVKECGVDICPLYCKALEMNGKSEAKNQWTLDDVVEEILKTFEKND